MPRSPLKQGGDENYVMEQMLLISQTTSAPTFFDVAQKLNESVRRKALNGLIKKGLVGRINGMDEHVVFGKTPVTTTFEQFYITEYGYKIIGETPWIKNKILKQ